MRAARLIKELGLPFPILSDPRMAFYWRVRPGGPGSRRERRRTRAEPAQDLGHVLRARAGLVVLLGFASAVGFAASLAWP